MDYFQTILPGVRIFASVAHQEQRRKYTGEPYIGHPERVAGIVSAWLPGDAYAVILAYLHDTVEDTDVTLERIAGTFGAFVAKGVDALTKEDTPGLNREQKLAAYRVKLAAADQVVQIVKAADIIANLSSVAVHDPKFGVTYCKEKLVEADVLTKLPPIIAVELKVAIDRALQDSEEGLVQNALGKKEGKL